MNDESNQSLAFVGLSSKQYIARVLCLSVFRFLECVSVFPAITCAISVQQRGYKLVDATG